MYIASVLNPQGTVRDDDNEEIVDVLRKVMTAGEKCRLFRLYCRVSVCRAVYVT